MSERPILFSAEMVRAILDGGKTQTRRVIKPQPSFNIGGPILDYGGGVMDYVEPHWALPKNCKYGAPGDTLWVRETWAPHPHGVMRCGAVYRADPDAVPDAGRWRPSIHMPRWASRLTLRITDVRVERLQDISEDDARDEGVFEPSEPIETYGPKAGRVAFRMLWNTINGVGAWDDNPWVWALTFERVKP